MSADVSHGAEDLEPELRPTGKAPAKKPLAEFLAEFEERLANHPDEPATGAMRVLEARAVGLRRAPAETPPTRYAEEAEIPAPERDMAATPSPAAPLEMPATPVEAPAEAPTESRRLRGRRRRKHRHKPH